MVKVYLASRFSRGPELLEYRDNLMFHGIECTSRWLLGGHEWAGTDDDALPFHAGQRFGLEDIEDIDRSESVICFTEAPRTSSSRGGRHVEFGYAIGKGKDVFVVGPRENVFYCLPEVNHYDEWNKLLGVLAREAERRRA